VDVADFDINQCIPEQRNLVDFFCSRYFQELWKV